MLNTCVVAWSPDDCTININGTRYIYRGSRDGKYLADKFREISKHSEGKALAWIKENAILVGKYS